MKKAIPFLLVFATWGLCTRSVLGQDTIPSSDKSCDLDAASEWIEQWFAAWELTSTEILHLGSAPPPEVLFYDAACVYTTSGRAASESDILRGPRLLGASLPWRVLGHEGMITLPDSSQIPIQLMTFAASNGESGTYFVMAAPDFWADAGVNNENVGRARMLTAVFLHEFAHTRQIPFFQAIIGPIEETWTFPEELGDDVVQERFESDSAYVLSYEIERDLFYRSAAATSITEARELATEALGMMRTRRARWFTGENDVFGALEDAFLSLEGAGQWTGYAWLAHPRGGSVSPDVARDEMRGNRRWWSQDEGLGLFLALDRLLPDWPSLVFGKRPLGALELLERAVELDGVPAIDPCHP